MKDNSVLIMECLECDAVPGTRIVRFKSRICQFLLKKHR